MTDWKPGDPLYPAPPYEVGDVPPRWHDETSCYMCIAPYAREPRDVVWSQVMREAA